MKYECKVFHLGDEVKASEASRDNFLKEFSSKVQSMNYRKFPCEIISQFHNDYFIGVIISSSSKKTSYQRTGDQITEVELHNNAELNFFAYCPSRNKGLYAGYWGAVPLNIFLTNMRQKYVEFVKKTREKSKEKENFNEKSKKYKDFSLKTIKQPEIVIDKRDIDLMMQRFKEIDGIRVSSVSMSDDILDLGKDVMDSMKRASIELKFDLVQPSLIRTGIEKAYALSQKIIGRKTHHKGGLTGIDNSGTKIEVNFDDFTRSYLTTEDISATLYVDLFSKHEVIEFLLDSMDDQNLLLLW